MSSALVPAVSVTSSGLGPKPPGERRARQAEVEVLLLGGASIARLVADLGPKYGVGATTLRNDARRVRRRWLHDDARRGDHRRLRAMRRLEQIAERAEAASEHQAATAALLALARIAGWIAPPSVLTQINNAGVTFQGPLVLPVSLMLPTDKEKA